MIDLDATDADGTEAEGSGLTYSETGGTGAALFQIDASTGVVTVSNGATLNYEGTASYTYTVQVADSSHTTAATVTVNLTNVNENPTLGAQSVNLPENTAAATLVVDLLAADQDAGDSEAEGTLTYAVTGGDGQALFDIDADDGEVHVAAAAVLNFEAADHSFALNVLVADDEGLTGTATITIDLTNVNETPVVNDQGFDVDENSAAATSVDTVVASDVDAGDTLTWSITAGNPNGDGDGTSAFAIDDGTGEITVADAGDLDFEHTAQHALTVQVEDAGGLTDTATITIDVNDVNDAPVVNNQTFSVAENSAQTTAVGTVVASDEDVTPPDTLTYSITGGNAGNAFAIDGGTGAITVQTVARMDHELYPQYSLTVRVRDNHNTPDTATVTIDVTDVNERPTIDAGADQEVAEGVTVSLDPATFDDPDDGDTHTATVNWGEGAGPVAATVHQANDTISGSHAYADNGVFTVIVTVTDSGALSQSDTLTVTVNNAAPVVAAGDDIPGSEGVQLSVSPSWTDVAGDGPYTLVIDWGDTSDDDTFAAAVSGAARTHTYADNGSYTVTATVTDKDGDDGSDALVVTVANVIPVVQAGNDVANASEGVQMAVAPTWTDMAGDGPYTLVVNWGDGNSNTYNAAVSAAARTHTYADNGQYTVTATVTDKDTGAGNDTLTVTVANVIPVVNAGADQPGAAEGTQVSAAPTWTDMAGDSPYRLVVNWGDGNSNTYNGATSGAARTHTYADNGAYTVTATVTDKDTGAGNDTLLVTVANVAPAIAAGDDQTVNEGDTVNLDPATFTDAGTGDTHTAQVQWNSGGGWEATVLTQGAGSGSIAANHVYTDNGSYTVTVRVADDDAPAGWVSDQLTVTVNTVTPVISAGGNRTVNEGTTLNLAPATFTDAGAGDTHTARVRWQAGGGWGAAVVTQGAGSGSIAASHVYPDNGSYVVTVEVTDDDGASHQGSFTVTVNNVIPVVSAGPDQVVNEAVTVSLAPSTFSDAGSGDTHTASIAWGDGNVEAGVVVENNGSGTAAASHVYDDDGDYTITVTVTDDDNGAGSDTLDVRVDNVAPTLVNPGHKTVAEAAQLSVPMQFSDPNSQTDVPYTVHVVWGDGQTSDYGTAGGTVTWNGVPKTYTLTATHTYVQDTQGEADRAVAVTVTDKDGGATTENFTVTVTNVPPVIGGGPRMLVGAGVVCNGNAGGAQTGVCRVNEGQTVTFAVDTSDVGADDTLPPNTAYEWVFSASRRFPERTRHEAAPTHIFDDDESSPYTVTFTVTDSDGATDADTLTIVVDNVAPTLVAASQTDAGALALEGGGAANNLGNFAVEVYDPSDEDCESLVIHWDFDTTVDSDLDGTADNDQEFSTPALGGGGRCGSRSILDKSDNSRDHTATHVVPQDHVLGAGGAPYNVRVWVVDDEGASDDLALTAGIDNVDPMISNTTTAANKTNSEQNPNLANPDKLRRADDATCGRRVYTYKAAVVDDGLTDTQAGFRYKWHFGDAATQLVARAAGAVTSQVTHVYADNTSGPGGRGAAPYTVAARAWDVNGITDDPGAAATGTHGDAADGADELSFPVTIVNAAPSAVPESPDVAEGEEPAAGDTVTRAARAIPPDTPVWLTARNSCDASPAQDVILGYAWDFNDGARFEFGPASAALYENGQQVCGSYAACAAHVHCDGYSDCILGVRHQYVAARDAWFNVQLTVTDDDGGTATNAFGVRVTDVSLDLAIEPPGAVSMDENAAAGVQLTGAVTNPSEYAAYTFVFDWGDGGVDQVGPLVAAPGDPQVATPPQGHVYLDNRPGGEDYEVTMSVVTGEGNPGSKVKAVGVRNVAPTATGITCDGVPCDEAAALEGVAVAFAGTSLDPSPLDVVEHEWDLDSAAGCPDFHVDATGDDVTRVFPDNGSYVVCMRARDDDLGYSAPISVELEVANVPPVALPPANVQEQAEGAVFTVDGSGTDVPGDSITAYDWELGNDDDPCEAVAAPGGSPANRAAFRCRDDGSYVGRLWVTDDDGGRSVQPAQFLVSIDNVRPFAKACVSVDPGQAPAVGGLDYATFPPAGCDPAGASVLEEEEAVFTAVAVDRADEADPDTATIDELTFEWDLGDGSRPQFGPQVRHAFTRLRPQYRVQVTVRDDDGGERRQFLTITVDNVPPVIPLDPDAAIRIVEPAERRIEGSPIRFVAEASDTGGAVLTYSWTAGLADAGAGIACNANREGPPFVAEQAGVGLDQVSFNFPDDDCYRVCLRVEDESGGQSDLVCKDFRVENDPPIAVAGEDVEVDEGEPFQLLQGMATDAGLDEGVEYWWEFGDCAAEAGFDADPLSDEHVYVDEAADDACAAQVEVGAYEATFHARDKDGGEGTDTLRVVVRNVAPVLPLLPPVPALEGVESVFLPGQAGPYPLCATDPGARDVHEYTFSWGDGTPDAAQSRAPDPDDGTRCGERLEGGQRLIDRPVTAAHTYARDGNYDAHLCASDDGSPVAGTSCRTFQVRVANDPPHIVGVDHVAARRAERRTPARFDQGIVNCLPVVVRDEGVAVRDRGANDMWATSCRLIAGPDGATLRDRGYDEQTDTLEDWRAGDRSQPPFPTDALALAANEHVPCWFCWTPPESAIDGNFVVRVEVRDDRDRDTHDWTLQVRISDDDDDSLPNTFEVNHDCLDPNMPNAPDTHLDPDEDGLDNLQEYERGSNPCDSNRPSAPAVAFPRNGGEVNAFPALLGVSNATDPDKLRSYALHDDRRPLHYRFEVELGTDCHADPGAACSIDGAELVAEGAEVTSWQYDRQPALVENTEYAWSAWACDGWTYGERVCGTFFFDVENSPPEPATLREPVDGAEDQPVQPTFAWACSRLSDPGLRVNTGDVDRDPVSYELELRVRGESQAFLRYSVPPCGAAQEAVEYPLPARLAEDAWYDWTVYAVDDSGARTQAVVPEGAADPPWTFLVNPNNVEPRAPELVAPVTSPLPRDDDWLAGIDVVEVQTLTPTLVFRTRAAPDPDGNVLTYRVELDPSSGFGSGDGGAPLIQSPELPVPPDEEHSWTVTGEGVPDNTPVWWRVRGVDRHGPGAAATTLIFVNTANDAPAPGGSGQHLGLDSLTPTLLADAPPPHDADRDLFECEFEVARLFQTNIVCDDMPDKCDGVTCKTVATSAERALPGPTGAAAWRTNQPLVNRAPHCWRHRCCDATECGVYSPWFPVTTNAPNGCPRGIGLVGPDGDMRLPRSPLPRLLVDNATDPDADATVVYQFQVFSDRYLAGEPLVDVSVPAGDSGQTALDLEQTGVEALAEARLTILRRAGVGDTVLYWRARARDGDDGCDSEWTHVGRLVLYQQPEDDGCCSASVAAPPPSPGAALPWLALLVPFAVGRLRRRVASRSRQG